MVLTRRQKKLLISLFNNLNVNPQVQNMSAAVKYVLKPFEGGINPKDPQGIKLYLQAIDGSYPFSITTK